MALIFKYRWDTCTRIIHLAGTAFNGFVDQDIFESQDGTRCHWWDYTEFH